MSWWRKAAKPPRTKARRRAALENAVGVLGAGLAAVTIGFIAWKGFTEADGAPEVSVSVTRIVPQDGVFLAEIEAFNDGNAVAAQLEVEGTLERSGETVETASTTFDYLPSHSRRRGGLFFSQDPRSGALTVVPKSYVDP